MVSVRYGLVIEKIILEGVSIEYVLQAVSRSPHEISNLEIASRSLDKTSNPNVGCVRTARMRFLFFRRPLPNPPPPTKNAKTNSPGRAPTPNAPTSSGTEHDYFRSTPTKAATPISTPTKSASRAR